VLVPELVCLVCISLLAKYVNSMLYRTPCVAIEGPQPRPAYCSLSLMHLIGAWFCYQNAAMLPTAAWRIAPLGGCPAAIQLRG
jgi:hypothetical protein